jgi:DNA-binding response OmpR family regulator
MSVPPLPLSMDIQRLPGCDMRCERRRYLNEITQQLVWTVDHNPSTHESYGAAWATRRETVIATGATGATGALVVDRSRNVATVDGARIRLTPRESQILSHLASKLGQVVPAADLLLDVFDDPRGTQYSRAALSTHVERLRKKLGRHRGLLVTHTPYSLELLAVEPEA